MVFTKAEMAEFESIMMSVEKDIGKNSKPQLSAVLMGLQFASVIPGKNNQMWFQDPVGRMIMAGAVMKMMDDNPPDMFSVAEKAFLFNLLHINSLCEAIDRAGLGIHGFPPPKPVNDPSDEPWKPQNDEGSWEDEN